MATLNIPFYAMNMNNECEKRKQFNMRKMRERVYATVAIAQMVCATELVSHINTHDGMPFNWIRNNGNALMKFSSREMKHGNKNGERHPQLAKPKLTVANHIISMRYAKLNCLFFNSFFKIFNRQCQ